MRKFTLFVCMSKPIKNFILKLSVLALAGGLSSCYMIEDRNTRVTDKPLNRPQQPQSLFNPNGTLRSPDVTPPTGIDNAAGSNLVDGNNPPLANPAGTLPTLPGAAPLPNPGTLDPSPATPPAAQPPAVIKPVTSIPVAIKVPGKPGHVYSPHTQRHIPVEGIMSGATVEDPTATGKYFKIP